jgi:hypothetical protein
MKMKLLLITIFILTNYMVFGQTNTATGTGALYQVVSSGGVFGGTNNTATGYNSLYYNYGNQNSAHGSLSLYYNVTGYKNSAYGYSTLYNNLSGYENTAIGYSSLYAAPYGIRNTAAGAYALVLTNTNNTGVNSGLGFWALVNNTTGTANTAIGWGTGAYNQTGRYNSYVGFSADANIANSNYAYSTAIGANTIVTGSYMVRFGDASVSSIGGAQSWTALSDKRLKKSVKQNIPGLSFIDILKPVTYNLDLDSYYKIVLPAKKKNSLEGCTELVALRQQSQKIKESILYTGFLAQDVESAAQSIGYDFSGIDAPKSKNDVYGIRYTDFVMPLVNGAKELNQMQLVMRDSLVALTTKVKNAINDATELEGDYGKAYILQVFPNPVASIGRIKYYIPISMNNSIIIFYNSSGQVVRRFMAVSGRKAELIISGQEFKSGTYTYSLIAGGKNIGTKKMIVIK